MLTEIANGKKKEKQMSQTCKVAPDHKTCGTISFEQKKPKWRCLTKCTVLAKTKPNTTFLHKHLIPTVKHNGAGVII